MESLVYRESELPDRPRQLRGDNQQGVAIRLIYLRPCLTRPVMARHVATTFTP
jgi:hypothetical protein